MSTTSLQTEMHTTVQRNDWDNSSELHS